jgi:hypothetical protein
MTIYNTSKAVAGGYKEKDLTCKADTYFVGMPLAYNASNHNYEYNATAPEVISNVAEVLASEGAHNCMVSGTEFLASAIVNDSGAALTITDDIRASFLKNGIILR